jgi:amino acid transporter
MAAAATCIIMGTIYTPSRIFYAMAKEGYMPKIFARVNPKTKSLWQASSLFG